MEQRLREKAKRRGLETSPLAQTVMLLALQEEDAPKPADEKRHSVMEFYGAGRDAWAGVDVQQYINEMRDEWDR